MEWKAFEIRPKKMKKFDVIKTDLDNLNNAFIVILILFKIS